MKPIYFFLLGILLAATGCQKFLDAKPDQSLTLPKDNLGNLQLLLNDTYTMNQNSPAVGEIASDNFYLSNQQWSNLHQTSATSANPYIFSTNLFNETNNNDWTLAYNTVFNANLVLDGLSQITVNTANQTQWNNIKGSALFFRSNSFYSLLREFALTYNQGDPTKNPGIVLRLSSDINAKSTRASISDCYNRILTDLQSALPLLPQVETYKTNPTKNAALGLLARVYLSMGNYAQSLDYAKQYLANSPDLIDFNTLTATDAYPLTRYNVEVSFHETLMSLAAFRTAYARVSDTLFNSYDNNDLRKIIFFKNGGLHNVSFKGSYDGSQALFGGVATDEVYLIAAESYVRLGDMTNGLMMLNKLLSTRWLTGTFLPYQANDQQTALAIVLRERHKELIFRNLRWSDLKRLNTDQNFQTTITRIVNDNTYTLQPGSSYYALPLPLKVVQEAGIAQN